MASFLSYQHPHYAKLASAWQLAAAMYTGEGASHYLVQHRQGESDTSFAERRSLADFRPLLSDVVDSLSGIVFEREDEVERELAVLGSPDAAGSLAARIWADADGEGTDYAVMLRRLAAKLLLYQDVWILTEGPAAEGGAPRFTLIDPLDVPNWTDTEVLVRESVDARTSIKDKPEPVEQYVLYTPSGWERWREANGAARLVESGMYNEAGRHYVSRSGEPAAPIFRVRLPFERYVAHQLADSQRTIYNAMSDRDHALRVAAYPKLVLASDDEAYEAQIKDLKKGSNVLQLHPESGQKHDYIAPSMDGVRAANETLEAKIAGFYDSAFRLFDSEGRAAMTATQAAMERSSGLAAALGMVAASLQEAESNMLYFAAQSVSDRPADWQVSVKWPTDYTSVNVELPHAA